MTAHIEVYLGSKFNFYEFFLQFINYMELQFSFVSPVAPGARERLVQITGPAEENIKYDIT